MKREFKISIIVFAALVIAFFATAWYFSNLLSGSSYQEMPLETPNTSDSYTQDWDGLPTIYRQDAYVGADFSVKKIIGGYSYNSWTVFYHGDIYVFESAKWNLVFSNVTYLQNDNSIVIYPESILWHVEIQG